MVAIHELPIVEWNDDLWAIESQVKVPSAPLVPLLPPPAHPTRPLPSLAPRSRKSNPLGPNYSDWVCDTYAFPAAFPRTPGTSKHPVAAPAPSTASPATGAKRIDVTANLAKIYTQAVAGLAANVDVKDPKTFADQEQMYLVANRYRKESATGSAVTKDQGLTLVACHANGFHKEIFEPMFTAMLDSPDTPAIYEIWSIDCANQGDSAIINQDVLGDTFHWTDFGRDVLQFLIYYIDSPTLSQPPTATSSNYQLLSPFAVSDPSIANLDGWKNSSPSPDRLWNGRKIVGLGHSFGGSAIGLAATSIPSLFSSIILVDPTLPSVKHHRSTRPMAGAAMTRKFTWKDKKAAKEAFLSKPFFRAWDQDVLNAHIEYGIGEAKDGGVTLKTSPSQEAATFGEPCAAGARRTLSRLHLLPSSLPTFFLWAGTGLSVLSEDVITEVMDEAKYATMDRVDGVSHLVAQLDPKGSATRITKFLKGTYGAAGIKAKL